MQAAHLQPTWSTAGPKSEGETAHEGFHPMTRCCSRRLPNLSPESSLGRVGPITLLYIRSPQDMDALRKGTQRSLGDALWLFEAHCQKMCRLLYPGPQFLSMPLRHDQLTSGPSWSPETKFSCWNGCPFLVFSTQTCKSHIPYPIGD